MLYTNKWAGGVGGVEGCGGWPVEGVLSLPLLPWITPQCFPECKLWHFYKMTLAEAD